MIDPQFTPLQHSSRVVVASEPAAAPLMKGTLHAVTEILRRAAAPLSVRQIVELAGPDLPTRSRTPMTVVARDLAMDIKNKGDTSAFVRTAPGRYTLRELLPVQITYA